MGVYSLPKTVTRQRRGCNLNPGLSALGSSTLTTRLPSHTIVFCTKYVNFTGADRIKKRQSCRNPVEIPCTRC